LSLYEKSTVDKVPSNKKRKSENISFSFYLLIISVKECVCAKMKPCGANKELFLTSYVLILLL